MPPQNTVDLLNSTEITHFEIKTKLCP